MEEIIKKIKLELTEDAEDFYQLFKKLHKMGKVVHVSIGERNKKITIRTHSETFSYSGDEAIKLKNKITNYSPDYGMFSDMALLSMKRQVSDGIRILISELKSKRKNSNYKNLSAHEALKNLLAEYDKIKKCTSKAK